MNRPYHVFYATENRYMNETRLRGFKILDISLVRAGGLGFYSRDFQSPGLKLTPIGCALPLQTTCVQLI